MSARGGYGAAVLARLAGHVVALEEDASLAASAQAALADAPNVTAVGGPLAAGWPQGAPYDAILLEGAAEQVPAALFEQLKDGGRLACVAGRRSVGQGDALPSQRRRCRRPGDLRCRRRGSARLRQAAGLRFLTATAAKRG